LAWERKPSSSLRRAGALALAAGLVAACDGGAASHVVLITVDSLRADHLGAYGYERDTSPRMDSLARDGTLFERALSSTNWTLPASAALLTGLSDSLHGVQDANRALAPGIPTLAQTLRGAGFATGAVVSGPLLHPQFGLDRGFDDYLNCMSYLDDDFAPLPDAHPNLHRQSHADVTGPCVVRRAREWLEAHRDGPAFLWLHFWDVHYDYRPPPGYAERFDPDYTGEFDASDFAHNPEIRPDMNPRDREHLRALYDGEIAYTDERIGEVLDALDALGLTNDTLVVLTADHGEAFFEHGHKGHRNELHAEEVRIPLILRGPGVPVGVRRPGPAHVTDVAPTLLALALGQPRATPGPGEGWDLRRALTDASALEGRWVLSELAVASRRQSALESLSDKILRDEPTGITRVFDLVADPGEQAGQPAPFPARQRLEALREQLASRRRAMPPPTPLRGHPAELEAQLRSLGYVH
jgi:arylsulfatase